MLKTMASSVYVSKGFNGPALKYSEKGDSVRFRIGSKVYDSRAEGNSRWVNLGVKAFGDVCARTLKMKLKEGSCINVSGRLDEERWKDRDTGTERSAFVLILDDIEYASSAKEGDGKAPQQSELLRKEIRKADAARARIWDAIEEGLDLEGAKERLDTILERRAELQQRLEPVFKQALEQADGLLCIVHGQQRTVVLGQIGFHFDASFHNLSHNITPRPAFCQSSQKALAEICYFLL